MNRSLQEYLRRKGQCCWGNENIQVVTIHNAVVEHVPSKGKTTPVWEHILEA
jgi:hypothetical protein